MIRNQWYIVLDSDEVKKGKPVGVVRMGERLVFWRDQRGKVICQRDKCPHLGASLSQGKVLNNNLKCPFHGIEYDTKGDVKLVPGIGRAGTYPKGLHALTYPAYEANDYIYIWWGDDEPKTPPKFFDDIGKEFSYIRFKQSWPVHYSRMLENQLDVMHLPFVHYNTIGRGQRTLVDGPFVKVEDNTLKLWVQNSIDDGTRPGHHMEEMTEPTRTAQLIVRLPNLWENHISDSLRIHVAFVPIDDEHTIMYGRYYQKVVRIPIFREFFNLIGKWGSAYIASQDRAVVSNQLPKKSELKQMHEKIMPGDRGILMFRQWRHQKKVESGQIIENRD